MMAATQQQQQHLQASLESALTSFNSTPLPRPPDSLLSSIRDANDHWIAYLRPHYTLCAPADAPHQALLGRGGFGSAYKVVRTQNSSPSSSSSPIRVLKLMRKDRVANSSNALQHLCAELAISGFIDHPNLNHRVDLFHSDVHIFVILEMCVAPRPDVLTQLAYFVATKQPSKICEIDNIYQKWIDLAKNNNNNIQDPTDEKNQEEFADFVENNNLMRALAFDLRVPGTEKIPVVNCDLWEYVWTYNSSRLPQPVRQVLTRQVLLGLNHLHSFNIVHRDVKAENVVIGITRRAEIQREKINNSGAADDDQPGSSTSTSTVASKTRIIGVTFVEKFDVKVIDFGLAKYMTEENTSMISPSSMIAKTTTATFATTTMVPPAAKPIIITNTNNDDENNSNNKKNIKNNNQNNHNRFLAASINSNNSNGNSVHPDALCMRRRKSDATAGGFVVMSTPGIGTSVTSPLEIITQIGRRDKFITTNRDLKKYDTYGVGFLLYTMSCRRLPFDMPSDPKTTDMKKFLMEQFEKYKTPVFDSEVSVECKEFCLQMLTQDVHERLSVRACLANSFVNEYVGDTVVTHFYADSSAQHLSWCRLLTDIQMGSRRKSSLQQQQNQEDKKNCNINEALAVATVLVAAIDGFGRSESCQENNNDEDDADEDLRYQGSDHIIVEDATATTMTTTKNTNNLEFSLQHHQEASEHEAKMLTREISVDNNNYTSSDETSKKIKAEMQYFRNANAIRVFSCGGGDTDNHEDDDVVGRYVFPAEEDQDTPSSNTANTNHHYNLSRVRLKSTTLASTTFDKLATTMMLDAMRGLADDDDDDDDDESEYDHDDAGDDDDVNDTGRYNENETDGNTNHRSRNHPKIDDEQKETKEKNPSASVVQNNSNNRISAAPPLPVVATATGIPHQKSTATKSSASTNEPFPAESGPNSPRNETMKPQITKTEKTFCCCC